MALILWTGEPLGTRLLVASCSPIFTHSWCCGDLEPAIGFRRHLDIVNGAPKWAFSKLRLGQVLSKRSEQSSLGRYCWGKESSRTRTHLPLFEDEESDPTSSRSLESLLSVPPFLHSRVGFSLLLSKQVHAGAFFPPERLFPAQQTHSRPILTDTST